MSKKVKKEEVQETEPGEWTTIVGTPTAVMLPARRYKFSVSPEVFSISVPKKGKFKDYDSKLFEKDGDFDVLIHVVDKDEYVVNISALSKVLFATTKYPKLEDNQAFAPIALIISKDNVEIVGNVIEMLKGDK
jgi:hypothetical protein